MPTMVAYGFGQVAESIKNQGFNVFLPDYRGYGLSEGASGIGNR